METSRMQARFAVLVVAALAVVPTVAAAQPAIVVAPVRVMERHGVFAGGGLWAGNISCEGANCGSDFRGAGGLNGQVGYMLSPRLGLLVDLWGMSSEQDGVDI